MEKLFIFLGVLLVTPSQAQVPTCLQQDSNGTFEHPYLKKFNTAFPVNSITAPCQKKNGYTYSFNLPDATMTFFNTRINDEYIDKKNGGTTILNLKKGLADAKTEANKKWPPGAVLVQNLELLPTISTAGNHGLAWGSDIVQLSDKTYREIVYLYAGHTEPQDCETFQVMDTPAEVPPPCGQ